MTKSARSTTEEANRVLASLSAIFTSLISGWSLIQKFWMARSLTQVATVIVFSSCVGLAFADDYKLAMSPTRYIPSNGNPFETVQVATGNIGVVVHMMNQASAQSLPVRIVQRPMSTTGPSSMVASADLSGLSDQVMQSNPKWGPWSSTASYASIPLSVNANIERASPSGIQSDKIHWQIDSYAALGKFKDRRVVELWVQYATGWHLTDWVTLTFDFDGVWILLDAGNSNTLHGNLSGLGKTLHLYEYGTYYGPMVDGSGVANSGSSSQRPGGINPNPDTICASCSRDDYYGALNNFDPESSTHPYEQQACDTGTVDAQTNSLRLTIGMGQAGFGRIGGNLELYAPEASPHLLEAGALALSLAQGNETIRDADTGRVAQFVSAASIADVVEDPEGNGYTLKFYNREAGQADTRRDDKTGKFETTGKAYVQIQIFSPDGAPQAGVDVHSIRVIRTNAVRATGDEVANYRYDAASETWELTKDDRNQIEQVQTAQSDDLSSYTKDRIALDASGQKQVHIREQHRRLVCGDKMVRQIVDPEGAARTTTWEYYTDLDRPGSLGRLKQVVRPDGNWHRYQYDRLGRTTKTVSQYLDAPVGAQEDLCKVSETRFVAPGDHEDADRGLRQIHIERIRGHEVRRSYVAFRDGAIEAIAAHSPGAPWEHAKNTVTKKHHYTDGPFRGDLKTVIRPDGTATLYKYELDGKTLLDSTQLTKTVTTGEIDSSASNAGNARQARDNDNEDDFPAIKNGTQSLSLVNRRGSTIAHQSEDIRTGTELSSWVATRIDRSDRVEQKTHSDGSTESKSYGCCNVDAVTDQQGVTTSYGKIGNRAIRSRQGMSEVTEITGRTIRKARIGTDGVEVTVSRSIYDLSGRIIQQTDALDRKSTFSYGY